MKKKNQLSKEPINLMPYRLKTEDSLDYISNRQTYKPRFIYELISSPDNSLSQIIKDFRSKGQEFKKIPVADNDFEGPSSIHPEMEKIKQSLVDENLKWQSEVRNLSIKNAELMSEIEYLKEKLENTQNGTYNLEEVVGKLQKELKSQKERLMPLEGRVEELAEQNRRLKEDVIALESGLRRAKENRNIPARSTHDSVRETREVYENISQYLKTRVQKLLNDMKKIAMSPKLQSLLQDFLEQILLINQYTVNKTRRRPPEEVQQVQPNLPFSVERAKLDKSIEKLKRLQKQVEREEKSYIDRSRGKGMGALSMLTGARERERSRSKSGRRRIFN